MVTREIRYESEKSHRGHLGIKYQVYDLESYLLKPVTIMISGKTKSGRLVFVLESFFS